MGTTGASTLRVSRIADWPGWCSPCQSEDRPLVLTSFGRGGLGAWLAGLGEDDRLLLLTCAVCGQWQVVPRDETDDPEIVLVDDDVLEAVAAVVAEAQADPAEQATVTRSQVGLSADVPPVPAGVPAARRPEGIVTVPERIVTVPGPGPLPAFSPEAVAAAARVLAAARASAPAARPAAVPVPAPRAAQPAPARVLAPPAPTSVALPAVHAGASQLVLATTC